MPMNEMPKIKDSQIVFDEFLKIKKERLCLPNRKDYNYYSLIPPASAVNILPITKRGTFILSEEYRHPTRLYLLSCPGGYINEGEPPEQAAERELMEETGCAAEQLVMLGHSYPYPGISNQKIFYLAALGIEKKKEQHLDANELIHPVEMSLEEIEAAIKSGRPTDGILCTALFFYKISKLSP